MNFVEVLVNAIDVDRYEFNHLVELHVGDCCFVAMLF